MIPHYFHHAKIINADLDTEARQLPKIPLAVLSARFSATRRWFIGTSEEGPWFPIPADTIFPVDLEGVTGLWFKADGPCELSVLALGTGA